MNSPFEELVNTIKTLREPINGCPWDLKQNIKSLAPSLLEECCECIDGISNNDIDNVKEELGDIIFTSTLISYILEQEKLTSINEIINTVNNKMISRHPHVFGSGQKLSSSKEVLKQWDEIKTKKEGRVKTKILDQIPSSMPPMDKSYEIQKKVEKVGFDWENINDIFLKITEETEEVKHEIESGDLSKLELEIGDLLFSVINLSRYLKINPSIALSRTNEKFMKRFNIVEEKMKNNKLEISKENFNIMDKFWEESK